MECWSLVKFLSVFNKIQETLKTAGAALSSFGRQLVTHEPALPRKKFGGAYMLTNVGEVLRTVGRGPCASSRSWPRTR